MKHLEKIIMTIKLSSQLLLSNFSANQTKSIISMLKPSNSPRLVYCIPINLTLFAGQTFSLYQSGLFCKSIGTNFIFSCNPCSPQITTKKFRTLSMKIFYLLKPLITNLINLNEQKCLFLFIKTNYCRVSSSASYYYYYFCLLIGTIN